MIKSIWYLGTLALSLLWIGCHHCPPEVPSLVRQVAAPTTTSVGQPPLALSSALHLAINALQDKRVRINSSFLLKATNTTDGWAFGLMPNVYQATSELLVLVTNDTNKPVLVAMPMDLSNKLAEPKRRPWPNETLALAVVRALDLLQKSFRFTRREEFFVSVQFDNVWQLVFRFPPYETHMGLAVEVDSLGQANVIRAGL